MQQQQQFVVNFTFEELENALGTIHSNVKGLRAVYIYGSKLYDVDNKNNSDIDMLCIQDDFEHFGNVNLLKYPNVDERDVYLQYDITLHFTLNNIQIETHIMSTKLFIEGLRQHRGILMQLLFLDNNLFILKEDLLFKYFRIFWFRNYHFHFRKFRRMIQKEADVWCFAKARRCLQENDLIKSKKNIIHGIRYYLFGKQIINNLTIVDYSVANHLRKEIDHLDFNNDWNKWNNYYEPIYKENRNYLNEIIQVSIDEGLNVTKNLDSLLKILNLYGLQFFSLQLAMHVIPILFVVNGKVIDLKDGLQNKYIIKQLIYDFKGTMKKCNYYINNLQETLNNDEKEEINNFSILFKITRDSEMVKEDESLQRKVLKECNGIIVEWNSITKQFKPICVPFIKLFDELRYLCQSTKNQIQNSNLELKNIDNIINIYKQHTGEIFTMYFYCNEWRVSHQEEEDYYFEQILFTDTSSQLRDKTSKFWNLLQQITNNNLYKEEQKCFILQMNKEENNLLLIGVRDLTTMREENPINYRHLFKEENIVKEETIPPEEIEKLEKELLQQKNTIKFSSSKEKNHYLLFKYLYHLSNQLNPILYKGFIVIFENSDRQIHKVKIQSILYYNLKQISIWHTSLQISNNQNEETSAFSRYHGNLFSQNNEMNLVEIAVNYVTFVNNEELMVLEQQNEQVKLFIEFYKDIKDDWRNICNLYNEFYETNLVGLTDNKEISKVVKSFKLEQKGPLFKMIEFNCSKSEMVLNDPRKVFEPRVLWKLWKDYKKVVSKHFNEKKK